MSVIVKSTLCATVCGEATAPIDLPDLTFLGDGTLSEKPLESGHARFILLKCDTVFTDVKDPAEWAALLASGGLQCSPKGFLEFGDTSETIVDVDACGDQCVTQTEQPFTFRSYKRACDGTEYKYYEQLFKNSSQYRIIPLDCNGLFNVPTEWADFINGYTDTAPANVSLGFPFSITKMPKPQDNSGNSEWSVSFNRELDNVCAYVALEGVQNAVCC